MTNQSAEQDAREICSCGRHCERCESYDDKHDMWCIDGKWYHDHCLPWIDPDDELARLRWYEEQWERAERKGAIDFNILAGPEQ